MSSFTPGPWKWSGRELEQDGGEWRDIIHTEVSCGSFCYGGCVDMTISDADRALIAAAPELLEALIDAMDCIKNICCSDNSCEPMMDLSDYEFVIAKATGACHADKA